MNQQQIDAIVKQRLPAQHRSKPFLVLRAGMEIIQPPPASKGMFTVLDEIIGQERHVLRYYLEGGMVVIWHYQLRP